MKMARKKALLGLILVLPSLIGIVIFTVYPFCKTVLFSFMKGLESGHFVGIDNYFELFDNTAFQRALDNTWRFYSVAIPLIMILPFALAVIDKHYNGRKGILRRSIFCTVVIPGASLMLFVDILFSSTGVANAIITASGGPSIDIYASGWSFVLLLFLFLFRYGGYNFFIYLVALNTIPREYDEEAQINGASAWQRLIYVELPHVLPYFIVTLILSIMNSYKIYREAFLIGGNYPHESIYMFQHFISNNFVNMNYNKLCCVSVLIMFVAVIVATILWGVNKAIHKG